MAWYKAAWIPPLFAALDRCFPARGRASDGTIGDPAHQAEVSGHNPDDTPGVRAERSDADSKPEVRAADVTSALGDPTLGMQAVVDAVLATPRDRDRLIYIIFNGSIWRKSAGWRREVYAGSDPHREHAHFSGDPAADDDGAPWTSILTLGGSMAGEADKAFSAAYTGSEPWVSGRSWMAQAVETPLRKLTATIAAIAEKVDISSEELAAIEAAAAKGAASAFDPAAIVARLAPVLAEHLGVSQAAVVAALESPAGQAALVQAHNTAEDS